MPPRKEPKEAVVYAASKRKPLPFKPQRPSKVPRTSTSESTSSISQRPAGTAAARAAPSRNRIASFAGNHNDEDSTDEEPQGTKLRVTRKEGSHSPSSSSSSDLPVDPRQAPRRTTQKPAKPPPPPSRHRVPSISSSSAHSQSPPPSDHQISDPILSQSDAIPAVPQLLLVRLLYEHFSDKTTQIDKHAIQVLQKYIEIFVREAIARASLRKKEDAEAAGGGAAGLDDSSWLDLEDLEKVAAGMILDF